jgi:hypothetical protein
MRTYYTIGLKKYGFFLIGIVSIIITSCGSYQNVSYYDNDGIYSSNTTKKEQVSKNNNENTDPKSHEYAQKFRAMQDEYTYFTDVNTYQSSGQQDNAITNYDPEYSNQNYAGWGNNASNLSINYYDNGWGWNNWYSPGWGFNNMGWGWNSWYGNNLGWGWNNWYGPNWGWGWNNWYGNGFYGPAWGGNWGWGGYVSRNVAYNGGRRGGSGYYNSGSGRIGTNYNPGRRTVAPYYTGTPRTFNQRNSNQNPRSTPQINANPRSSSPRSNAPDNNSVSPRNTTSEPRNNSNFSSPRSSSSGGSFGGGGRSGGGGGRGGRGGRG